MNVVYVKEYQPASVTGMIGSDDPIYKAVSEADRLRVLGPPDAGVVVASIVACSLILIGLSLSGS